MVIATYRGRVVGGALALALLGSASAGVRGDLQFNQGVLPAALQGTVTPSDHDRYFFVAKQGQQLRVQLQSSNSNGIFSLYGPGYIEESNGFVAGKSMQYESIVARVLVLTSGTHLIDVSSLGGRTSYRMSVTLDGASEFGGTPTGDTTVNGFVRSAAIGETKVESANFESNSAVIEPSAPSFVEQKAVGPVEPSLTAARDPNPALAVPALTAPPTFEAPKRDELAKPGQVSNAAEKKGFWWGLGRVAGGVVNALGSLLLACGVVACCVGCLGMPKPDRRFKTGYKDNRVVTWQFRAIMIGVAFGAAPRFAQR